MEMRPVVLARLHQLLIHAQFTATLFPDAMLHLTRWLMLLIGPVMTCQLAGIALFAAAPPLRPPNEQLPGWPA